MFNTLNCCFILNCLILSLQPTHRAHENTEGTSPCPAFTVSAGSFNITHSYITEIMSSLSIFMSFFFIPQSSETKEWAVGLPSPDIFVCQFFNSDVSSMTPCLWTLSSQSNVIPSFQMNSLVFSFTLISSNISRPTLGFWCCNAVNVLWSIIASSHTHTCLRGSLCGSHDSNGHVERGITDQNNESLQFFPTHTSPIYDTMIHAGRLLNPWALRLITVPALKWQINTKETSLLYFLWVREM